MELCYIVIDRKYLKSNGIIRAYRFGKYFWSADDVLDYYRKMPDDADLFVVTAPTSEVMKILERNKKCI